MFILALHSKLIIADADELPWLKAAAGVFF